MKPTRSLMQSSEAFRKEELKDKFEIHVEHLGFPMTSNPSYE